MLTADALKSAIPLTQLFDNAGLVVTAAPGTPLAALVAATRVSDNSEYAIVESANPSEYVPDIEGIVYLANAKEPTFDISQHDAVMDDVGDVCIRAVKSHIQIAKSVVAPIVQDLAERTIKTLAELSPSILLGMEVVVWNPPAPLMNSALEASIARFEEAPFMTPPMSMKLPSQTVQEITALMGTGNASLDRDVAEWLATKGESFLINLWEEVFQQKQSELNTRSNKAFRDYTEHPVDGLDNALAIYLLTRKLAEEPLEGTEMSLPGFERLAIDFRNQSAARLMRALAEQDSNVRNGILVKFTTERTTVVNGAVYSKFIEEGGDNDVLFGNLLVRPSLSSVAELNAKATDLREAWVRHSSLVATTEALQRFSRTKEILSKHFRAQLIEATDGQEAAIGGVIETMRLFDEQLAQVRTAELDDLYSLSLRLVCRSRFAKTSAEEILEGIATVSKANPRLDVRQAATISILNYVRSWVSSQFVVTTA